MEACPICAKHQGAVVGRSIYEDDMLFAHHVANDEGQTFLGYVRAETKRHVPSYAELTSTEAQALGLLVARLSRALKDCIGADHVYVFFYGDLCPTCICISSRAILARLKNTGVSVWASGLTHPRAVLRRFRRSVNACAVRWQIRWHKR